MTLRLVTDDEPASPGAADVADIPAVQTVAYAGRLAFVTHGEFVKLVEQSGSRFTAHPGRHTSILVVGQQDWSLNPDGTLAFPLDLAGRETLVVSEERFLNVLGLQPVDRREPQLYTASTLCDILSVPRARLRAWVRAGLIAPAKQESGVMHFDFRQVSVAKLLWDLSQSGVPTIQLRRSLQQLRAWMPDVEQPLEQLAVLERAGRLLVRMEKGLAEPDGQFHFDFTDESEAGADDQRMSMKLHAGPTTAAGWHEQGIEQERSGYVEEAIESYRQALLAGGPNARICFDLAHALHLADKKPEAAERYRQALELDAKCIDAWNNLGVVLSEIACRGEACTAFERALSLEPNDIRAHYNLADELETMGLHAEAAPHWRAYLRQDPHSPLGIYARSRLG